MWNFLTGVAITVRHDDDCSTNKSQKVCRAARCEHTAPPICIPWSITTTAEANDETLTTGFFLKQAVAHVCVSVYVFATAWCNLHVI